MTHPRRKGLRWRVRLLGGLAAPLLLSALGGAAEPPATAPEPAPLVAPAAPPLLDLAACVRIALDQQPALAAQRASLAAARTQQRGLEDLNAPPIFEGKELPVRRKQACLGVTIAEAGLAQAEHDTVYAVKRMYLAVLFARDQQRVADEVVNNLKFYQNQVKEAVQKGESRDWNTGTVDKITVYLGLAQVKQAEAARGIDRATAALKEAMGVGPDYCPHLADDHLPAAGGEVCCGQVIALALARRGELIQASTALEVTTLEIDAQAATHLPTTRTFAAVSDIHARPIPQGVMNGEYRPGAIGLEMPPNFAGPRSARIERAKDLNARAAAVVDKTRNLIALEAEDVYLRYQEASRTVSQSREAARAGIRLAEDTGQAFRSGQRVKIEDLLTNEVLASQARSAYNEARYHLAIALAALERVTAGAYCPVYDFTAASKP